jgi:hypothetical protein
VDTVISRVASVVVCDFVMVLSVLKIVSVPVVMHLVSRGAVITLTMVLVLIFVTSTVLGER